MTSPRYLYYAASSGRCEDYGYNSIVPLGVNNFIWSAAAELCEQAANALRDAEEIGSISANTCTSCHSNVGPTHWYNVEQPYSCIRASWNSKLWLSTNENNKIINVLVHAHVFVQRISLYYLVMQNHK